jgi:hypothetical protein
VVDCCVSGRPGSEFSVVGCVRPGDTTTNRVVSARQPRRWSSASPAKLPQPRRRSRRRFPIRIVNAAYHQQPHLRRGATGAHRLPRKFSFWAYRVCRHEPRLPSSGCVGIAGAVELLCAEHDRRARTLSRCLSDPCLFDTPDATTGRWRIAGELLKDAALLHTDLEPVPIARARELTTNDRSARKSAPRARLTPKGRRRERQASMQTTLASTGSP